MAVTAEDCTFISGRVLRDGTGHSGWGVTAYLTTRDGQATPVGFELGFQSSTPTNYSLTNAGSLERLGDTLWHFGSAMGVGDGIALAALDVSDPTQMRVIWDQVIRTWPVHLDSTARWMPVSLRAEGGRLYAWKNFDAESKWYCRVWDVSKPSNPIAGNLLSWGIPAVWQHRGRDHHAVSRGALYVLDPVSWIVRVIDCTDPAETVVCPSLPLPANLHADARIACDDELLVAGIRHFEDGTWTSALIAWEIGEDPLSPTEAWRLSAPDDRGPQSGPTWQPIGISGNDIVYTDSSNRVMVLDAQTQEMVAQSELLPPQVSVLDWDVRDGLVTRKLCDERTLVPRLAFESIEIGAIGRLPAAWSFAHNGYAWWPSGWVGTPEDLGHQLDLRGPGIVAGLGGEEGIEMYTDPTGVPWVAWTSAGTLYVAHLDDEAANRWSDRVAVAEGVGGGGVGITGDGAVLRVSAVVGSSVQEWHSRNNGVSWEGPYAVG